MLDGGVHRQPLRRWMFARHHDIDVMAAAQAMSITDSRQLASGGK